MSSFQTDHSLARGAIVVLSGESERKLTLVLLAGGCIDLSHLDVLTLIHSIITIVVIMKTFR
jgi:hypothetical protein